MSVVPEREITKNRMKEICNQYPRWLTLDVKVRDAYIRRIERGCYNSTIETCIQNGIERQWTNKEFVSLYSTETGKIMADLDIETGSSEFIDSIINHNVNFETITELKSYDRCPSSSVEIRTMIKQRQEQKIEKKYSKLEKCPKCSARKTSYSSSQKMSADEIATTKFTCQECGHSWSRS